MTKKTILLVLPACDYGTKKEDQIISALESEGVNVISRAQSNLPTEDLIEICDKCCFAGFDHDLHSSEAPSGWIQGQGARRPARRVSQQIFQTVEAFRMTGKPAFYVNYVWMDNILAAPIKFFELRDWDAPYTLLNRHQTEALYCASGF